jgi:cytidylate kinase
VSRHKVVRQAMVREQRRMGEEGGVVLEGRDIGTVVFPDADLKFFVVAHIEERARRRQKDLRALGRDSSVEELIGEMQERDRRDSTREESPLRRASDALELDTSCLTIDEQVRFVLEKVREKLRET